MEVIPLFEGYSKEIEDHQLANCSSTLLKGSLNIIVDTMTAWDGPKIVEALKENNLTCSDIQYVICTHGHSDHIGTNYLFPQATHIVGFSISQHNKYFSHDFKGGSEFLIEDGKVRVIPTPGHTLQDVSIVVKNIKGEIVAITGDLFENEQDLMDDNIWKSAGSDSEHLQKINRQKILNMADFIIPGHGPMFKVDCKYKLKQLC